MVTSNESTVTVQASAYDGLSLSKTSTTTNYSNSGDVINYDYLVTNTGTTTITGIGVTDNLVPDVSCTETTLQPGDSETCTGSYTVSESDVESGSVTNTAYATGTDPSDNSVTSSTSSATVPSTYTTTGTNPSSPTGALGATNTDVAQITGNEVSGNPTGSVTFYECGPTAGPEPCVSQANQVGGDVSVSSSGSDQATATSAGFTATSTGYWCFAGYYGGDSNYTTSSDTSLDECYDVTSATTGTRTTPTHASITLGDSDTDGVVVTGNSAGGSPTGSVDFYECAETTTATPCVSQADELGSESLTAGSDDTAHATSPSFTPTSTGYWCLAGYYQGDSNYDASSDTTVDECVDVLPLSSSTVTTPAHASIVLGTSVTDGVVVTGAAAGGSPTGSVTFYECGPTADETACTSENNEVGTSNLMSAAGNTATATSDGFTPTSTGYWCFAGVYSGDSNYNPSSDTNTTECVDVTPATTTTVTSPNTRSIVLGSADNDTATVTGNDPGGSPTGTVTFYECGETATPTPCTSKANQVGGPITVLVATADTAFAESASFTPTSTGYWCLAGYYSGDSNYSSSSDTSVDECVTVTKATSSTVTRPTSTGILLTKTNTDNVTVTGNSAGGAPTGTVTFYECGATTAEAACTSKSHKVGTAVTITPQGSNDYSDAVSASFKPTAVGYTCFGAYYSGNSNYSASSDTLKTECFYVAKKPTITKFSPTSGAIGATVTITGTNLLHATQVTLGGKTATISSDTATTIKVKVPTGAVTGKIVVTTAGGTATSATNFRVT